MQTQSSSGGIESQIDDTTSALSGGLTAVPLSAASSLISKWESTLKGSGNAGLESISEELGHLGTHLSGGSLDAKKVGEHLTSLSSKVSTVAGTQSGMVSSSLSKLSSALSSAGSQLSA